MSGKRKVEIGNETNKSCGKFYHEIQDIIFISLSKHENLSNKISPADNSLLPAHGAVAQHPVRGHDVPGAVHVHRASLHPSGHAGATSQDCPTAPGQGSH